MDGHFWIKNEGVIIDPYFKSYDFVKSFNDLEGDRIYLPASPLIQAVMKKRFIDGRMEMVKDGLKNGMIKNLSSRRDNCCNINAILEQLQNGGEIVFGSLGWKRKGSKEIWWEYGGADYTVADFVGSLWGK